MDTADSPLIRCDWARKPLDILYHDREWGVPVHDDRQLLEFLILEGAQAGLSWSTILAKREAYRKAFSNFDAVKVARFSEKKIAALLLDPGIVRNRLKIYAAVQNAKAFREVQDEFGSFDSFIWRMVGGKPIVNSWKNPQPGSRPDDGVRRDEQRAVEARLQVRGSNHLLRLHAGGRYGGRSLGQLLPAHREGSAGHISRRPSMSTSS